MPDSSNDKSVLMNFIEEKELLVFPGFDEAIYGVVESRGLGLLVCYIVEDIIEILFNGDHLDRTQMDSETEDHEAYVYYETNFWRNGYLKKSPVFMERDSFFAYLVEEKFPQPDFENYLEEQDIELWLGFEGAIVNTVDNSNFGPAIAYDYQLVIQELVRQTGSEKQALALFETKTSQMSENNAPVFLKTAAYFSGI